MSRNGYYIASTVHLEPPSSDNRFNLGQYSVLPTIPNTSVFMSIQSSNPSNLPPSYPLLTPHLPLTPIRRPRPNRPTPIWPWCNSRRWSRTYNIRPRIRRSVTLQEVWLVGIPHPRLIDAQPDDGNEYEYDDEEDALGAGGPAGRGGCGTRVVVQWEMSGRFVGGGGGGGGGWRGCAGIVDGDFGGGEAVHVD